MRVGIIGCGYWGKNHVRVLSELPDVAVVHAADKLDANLAAVKDDVDREKD